MAALVVSGYFKVATLNFSEFEDINLKFDALFPHNEVENPKADKPGNENYDKIAQGLRLYDFVFVANQQQKLRHYCNYYVKIPMFKNDVVVLKFSY